MCFSMRGLIFNIMVLTAVLSLLNDSAVRAREAAPTDYAIVVGIGDYPEASGWSRIHGDRDVPLVVGMLERNGFAKENIISLVNEEATKKAIENAFLSLRAGLKAGDQVYVHLSGHGQQVSDLDGDEEDDLDEAFVPYDACKKYVQGKYEGENHLVDDELFLLLSGISEAVGKDGLVMIVIDACHSGDATRDIGNGADDPVIRGTADLFEIPVNASCESDRRGAGQMSAGSGRKVSWICLSACKSYQNNNEYETEDGYYGRLSWVMNKVFVSGMRIDDLISQIESEFSSLPCPHGPSQTPDFEYPRDRSTVRIF